MSGALHTSATVDALGRILADDGSVRERRTSLGRLWYEVAAAARIGIVDVITMSSQEVFTCTCSEYYTGCACVHVAAVRAHRTAEAGKGGAA